MFARDHDIFEVEAFLRERFGDVFEVELIGSGAWSQAFSFRLGEHKRVVRLGHFDGDYRKDRACFAFAGPELPVPEVHEIGPAFDGYFATSTFLEGEPFDGLDEAGYRRILPSLLRTLDAIREVDVSGTTGYGIWGSDGQAPHASWREMLLDIANDRPGSRVHGWREALQADAGAVRRFDSGFRELQRLVEGCPELRHVIHADLMADNVRVSGDRVTAVVDWANAMYGDFVYDLARLEFWRPWFPALENVDFAAEAVAHYAEIGLDVPDFERRLRTCQVHLGLEAQAYNAFIGDGPELERSGLRTLELARV